MKARIIVPILLLVLLAGLCSACSKDPAESEPVTEAPSASAEVPSETSPETTAPENTEPAPPETTPQTPPESEPVETTPFEPAAVVIPAPEMGDKPRLSERPAEEIIDYLYDFGYDFMSDAGSKPDPKDPKKDKETVEKTLAMVREAEESPYSFMGHANYYLINNSYEKLRKAVCAYYEWPVIRLILESGTDGGTVVSEFQLWSLPDAFFGRDTKTTETGVRMAFISPSAQKPDFRRKMTIWLEPAETIFQKEQEEDPSTVLKDSAGYGSFSGASAVIYDHGDNAYTIYLRPEDGPAAVKIEASLTLEEMADLISGCRLFDAAKSETVSPSETTPSQPTVVIIPAPDMGDKPRLSEFSDEDLINYMLAYGVVWGSDPGPAGSAGYTKLAEETRNNVLAIEADPYGFYNRAVNYTEIAFVSEKIRCAVCDYYEWPQIRLTLKSADGDGAVLTDFQLWSLPEKTFHGRVVTATETGVKMTFISPSPKPQSGDFRRKMTIYLEPAKVITQKEQEEDPATALKDSAGYGSFSGASAIIYDHGDNAYTIYLRPEDGPAAVKIEASLTLEEMADLISGCRLFEMEE